MINAIIDFISGMHFCYHLFRCWKKFLQVLFLARTRFRSSRPRWFVWWKRKKSEPNIKPVSCVCARKPSRRRREPRCPGSSVRNSGIETKELMTSCRQSGSVSEEFWWSYKQNRLDIIMTVSDFKFSIFSVIKFWNPRGDRYNTSFQVSLNAFLNFSAFF